MPSLLKLFTPTRQVKAEKARAESIANAKMIPTRDTTDALRHEGKGLKTWSSSKSSLQSLGFNKISGVLKPLEYGADIAVGITNPKQKKGIKERLKDIISRILKKKKRKKK